MAHSAEQTRKQILDGAYRLSAPVIRNTDTGREMAMMRWGMPPPPRTAGPQYLFTPLAHVAQAGKPISRGL